MRRTLTSWGLTHTPPSSGQVQPSWVQILLLAVRAAVASVLASLSLGPRVFSMLSFLTSHTYTPGTNVALTGSCSSLKLLIMGTGNHLPPQAHCPLHPHRWFCHVDDDNYVNPRALLQLLKGFPQAGDVYVGRPSLNRPIHASEPQPRNRTVGPSLPLSPIGCCFKGRGRREGAGPRERGGAAGRGAELALFAPSLRVQAGCFPSLSLIRL